MEDPYEILGISRLSSSSEIRIRYYELAKKHHPDRLLHLPIKERNENEEYFKKITSAYSTIEKELNSDTKINNDNNENFINSDWRKIWNNFENLFHNEDLWSELKTYVKKKLKNKHIFHVDVTLEEIYFCKKKKLRLFLEDYKTPIFLTLSCDAYPLQKFLRELDDEEILIEVKINITPHKIYRILDNEDSDDEILKDLYCNIEINWYEYLTGKNITLPFLDNSDINVDIEPFYNVNKSITISKKGMIDKGNLYIDIYVKNPSKEEYLKIKNANPSFLENLNAVFS